MSPSPHDAPPRGAVSDEDGKLVALPRRARKPPPTNLPFELSSFVGREREMEEVGRVLSEIRLLTLTGPGGSGKTRLALRVARESAEGFSDGVWLVELAPISDPELVGRAVASILGIHEQAGSSWSELLAENLGNTLLVLDNCEHVIEGCARLAGALLRVCPQLKVLATSREALGVSGEISWPVPPLSVPEAGEENSPEALLRHDAAALFCERARVVAPDFELAARNVAAVARICRRLDGMPLAIELAAARTNMLSPRQILNRLDDRFRLLTGGRVAVPRHKTLRATMDWSHDLLEPAERTLFRRLSAFAGDFSLEAAEAVCSGGGIGAEDVLDLLSGLVDKSLVVVERGEEETRYRLLETVRQYAREKLDEAGEEGAIRDRHADFFFAMAEEAEPELAGAEQEAWMERLNVDRHHLWDALGWLAKRGGAAKGLRFITALGRYLRLGNHYGEGRPRISAVLALPAVKARTRERAEALFHFGEMVGRQHDHEEGHRIHEESLSIRREVGDEPGVALSLRHVSQFYIETEEWEEARRLLEESLEIERGLGDHDGGHGLANSLFFLGWLDHFEGENAAARERLEEAVEIFGRLGDAFYAGACVYFLGRVATDLGEFDLARERFAQGMEAVRVSQFYWVAPYLLCSVARLAAARGRAHRAVKLAGATEGQREAMGMPLPAAWTSDLERKLAPPRAALGERRAAAAFEEGRAMTMEEALSELERELNETAGAEARPRSYPDALTGREVEVLRMVAGGKKNKEIAGELTLSVATVERHIANIYKKIGARGRAEATAYAMNEGITEPPSPS